MWQEKLGNYLIDVSKYILIGVVVSSFFKDFGDSRVLIYGFGTALSVASLIIGLVLITKNKEDKKWKK